MKMAIRATFCDLGICSLHIRGMGKTSSTISVVMFGTAIPKYHFRLSKQVNEGIDLSQKAFTGVQENMFTKT